MNLYRIENLEYGDECFVVAESKEIAHELSIFKDVEYVSIVALAPNITIQEPPGDKETQTRKQEGEQ